MTTNPLTPQCTVYTVYNIQCILLPVYSVEQYALFPASLQTWPCDLSSKIRTKVGLLLRLG